MKTLADILTPDTSSRYGAPMGRHDSSCYTDANGDCVELDVLANAAPFHLVKIRLNSGGYDDGGAYWGARLRGESLYGYVGPIDDIRGYVDARNREQAKAIIRERYPLARFYR